MIPGYRQHIRSFGALGGHRIGNAAHRDEFPDIVGYKGCEILNERDISDAFARYHVA